MAKKQKSLEEETAIIKAQLDELKLKKDKLDQKEKTLKKITKKSKEEKPKKPTAKKTTKESKEEKPKKPTAKKTTKKSKEEKPKKPTAKKTTKKSKEEKPPKKTKKQLAEEAAKEKAARERTLEEDLEEELTPLEIENFQIEKVDMERLTNKVCEMLAVYESTGVFQSELWKKLKLSGRDGSRLALKLERIGIINREKILEKGRWTYKLILKKTPISTESIVDAPCLICPVEQKCSIDGDISPKTCQWIEDWVLIDPRKPKKA